MPGPIFSWNMSTAPGVGSSSPDFSQRSTTNINPGAQTSYWLNPFSWMGASGLGLSTYYMANRGSGQSILEATGTTVGEPVKDAIIGAKGLVETLREVIKWIWIPLLVVLVFFILKRK